MHAQRSRMLACAPSWNSLGLVGTSARAWDPCSQSILFLLLVAGAPKPSSQRTRQWIMGGLMVAACGLVALTASAGQSSRQQEAAAFAALVADEPLRIEVNSDTYMGYGNLTKYPFLAEGYGVLVEPHRSSTIKV